MNVEQAMADVHRHFCGADGTHDDACIALRAALGCEPCPVDNCSGVLRGQPCPNQKDMACAICGVLPEEPDEAIQPGDYYTVNPHSPRRCPSCGMFPARNSEGARRIAELRNGA